MRPARWGVWGCILTLVQLGGSYGRAEPLTTADEVVARLIAADKVRAELLDGYSSARRYFVENKRFSTTSELLVKMRFTRPDVKEFEVVSAKGSGFIRKRVLQRMMDSEKAATTAAMRAKTQISPANYTFRLTGTELLDGRNSYILEAEPRTKNIYLFRGKVWVDAEDFAVAQVEGSPAQNPSVWMRSTKIQHRYRKFGPVWLAVRNLSETDVVVFGRTTSLIEYSDYKLQLRPDVQSGTPAIQ